MPWNRHQLPLAPPPPNEPPPKPPNPPPPPPPEKPPPPHEPPPYHGPAPYRGPPSHHCRLRRGPITPPKRRRRTKPNTGEIRKITKMSSHTILDMGKRE